MLDANEQSVKSVLLSSNSLSSRRVYLRINIVYVSAVKKRVMQ